MMGAAFGLFLWLAGAALIAVVVILKKLIYIAAPTQVYVFSGIADGDRGYKWFRGERRVRIPLLQVVDEIDLSNMTLELTVQNAYTRGGIPLTVQGVASVKVAGDAPLIHNALERFLGYSREHIMAILKETLEGNLRGVLATLTPEEINNDMQAFSERLTDEADHDLQRLGLELDTLRIQNVSDDVGYLAAIGRMRSADVRKSAAIAEANAQAEAAENKWRNVMQAELAKLEARIQVALKDNERRIADATTRREALIAEELAAVQASIAQGQAELGLQEARIEQVRLQLQAEVIQPADAKRREAEQLAKGAAARIVEQGQATARVLSDLAREYKAKGNAGRDALLMQKLLPIIRQVVEPLGQLEVNRLTILGAGNVGDSQPLAASILGASEQIKAATGIDVPAQILKRL